jgi:hypothetical protein
MELFEHEGGPETDELVVFVCGAGPHIYGE